MQSKESQNKKYSTASFTKYIVLQSKMINGSLPMLGLKAAKAALK